MQRRSELRRGRTPVAATGFAVVIKILWRGYQSVAGQTDLFRSVLPAFSLVRVPIAFVQRPAGFSRQHPALGAANCRSHRADVVATVRTPLGRLHSNVDNRDLRLGQS